MNGLGKSTVEMNKNGIGVIEGGSKRQLHSGHHEGENDQQEQKFGLSQNSQQQSHPKQPTEPTVNSITNGVANSSQTKIHPHHHCNHHQNDEEDYDDPLLPQDSKGRTPIHHACASLRDPLRRPDLVR